MMEANKSCCAPLRDETNTEIKSKNYSKKLSISADYFISVAEGNFIMGTDDCFYPTDGENPCREVWLDEFKIGKFSVTNREFAEFVDESGYKTEAETYGWSYVFVGLLDEETKKKKVTGVASTAPWWSAIEGANWRRPTGNFQTIDDLLDHPVVHVSYNDALQFCNWSGYKLPSEAQWEKASRGGLVGARYPWGNEFLVDGNINANIWQGEFLPLTDSLNVFHGTFPVDSFLPNDFGLYNMVGNVWEWTNDYWSSRWHINPSEETRRNPKGPAKVSGNKVLKGGSFMCHDSYCYRYRNSARTYNSPNTSTSNIGFRCVV